MVTQLDWHGPVTAYLKDKDFVGLSAIARDALGLSYEKVDSATWRKLAFVVGRCGFRSTYIAGAGNVWTRKAPTPSSAQGALL